jgi:hypothetical protein
MADDSQDVAEARRLGAGEGDAFDLRLRQRERDERDELFARGGGGMLQPTDDHAFERPSLDELAMRREVDRLTAYYDAVQNSRVWRLTQRVRQLMGRQW